MIVVTLNTIVVIVVTLYPLEICRYNKRDSPLLPNNNVLSNESAAVQIILNMLVMVLTPGRSRLAQAQSYSSKMHTVLEDLQGDHLEVCLKQTLDSLADPGGRGI